jgi:hypothetical protein
LKAHAQQDLFGMNVSLHARIAKCAQQDRVEIAAQHLEAVRRNGNILTQMLIRTPVKLSKDQGSTGCLKRLDGQRNNFFADAVPGENRYAFL